MAAGDRFTVVIAEIEDTQDDTPTGGNILLRK
jgi:hypothetical protein